MGKFKLDKSGVEKIRQMLEGQVAEVEKRLACTAYDYFMNFAYKIDGGGVQDGGGGWTLYYLSNWNVCINGIDFSVFPAERDAKKGYRENINREKAKTVTEGVVCGDTITVTNSVWYGADLNNGGLYRSDDRNTKPNRFIELCQGHIKDNVNIIIKQVAKDCPDI